MSTSFWDFWDNFQHNLFKPLLLFFYMGFLIPILRVDFEFPHVIYQGLTIFLLVAIGWRGGEELAELKSDVLSEAIKFMGVGLVTNFLIGISSYLILRKMTRLRRVDAATVSGYYGSDSAGTFATCVGVMATLAGKPLIHPEYVAAAYMPVMLAVMEVPGCLVALFLVSKLRHGGMDALGNMPDEPGYDPKARVNSAEASQKGHGPESLLPESEFVPQTPPPGLLSPKLLHEVFLNPGLYLLFGGIIIGYLSRSQGKDVSGKADPLFLDLFQGILCLFLLEMGITASRKLRDLRQGGIPFILFGLIAPVVFATFGIVVAHVFSLVTQRPLTLATYVVYSVLCGAASYIAVPAVQRLAIPEASSTLPLAASLGLTFSFNVTIGIPLYIQIARLVMNAFPVK